MKKWWPGTVAILLFCSILSAAGIDLGNEKKAPNLEDLQIHSGEMNNERLETLLKSVATIREGQLGAWTAVFEGRLVIVLTDEANNRMRVITPIIESKKLDDAALKRLMEANFESALDARYALFKDYLWSVYVHPLAELSGAQFLDALNQVKQLADTFGDSYSSTGVVFKAE